MYTGFFAVCIKDTLKWSVPKINIKYNTDIKYMVTLYNNLQH